MSIKDEEPDWAPGSVAAQKGQRMDGTNHIDPGDPPLDRYVAQEADAGDPGAWFSIESNDGKRYKPDQIGVKTIGKNGRLYESFEFDGHYMWRLAPGMPAYEGPNYHADDGAKEDGTQMFWINLGVPAELVPPHTQEILRTVVVDALALWVRRNVEYGDEAKELGAKGQYADINRKVRKLKRLLWDEDVPAWAISEDVEQVVMDLIGHSILTIDLLRKGNKHGN